MPSERCTGAGAAGERVPQWERDAQRADAVHGAEVHTGANAYSVEYTYDAMGNRWARVMVTTAEDGGQ